METFIPPPPIPQAKLVFKVRRPAITNAFERNDKPLNFLDGSGSYYHRTRMADTTQQLYEQSLVLRSQIGDEAAFEQLMALEGPRVGLFTRNMLGSELDRVEDLTQEIWISIFRGLPSLQDTSKFRPWAFRIARDRIYREYRRRKLPVQPMDDDVVEIIRQSEDTAFDLDMEEVQRGLAMIPHEQREILVLRFFEDMSYEDLARATGCALGTVRSRIHYAKRALKNALERTRK